MKLTEYAALAASDFLQETGSIELDACWIAEYFQNSGVLDEYPAQDLVAFSAMVQKVLIRDAERASKQARSHITRIINLVGPGRKP